MGIMSYVIMKLEVLSRVNELKMLLRNLGERPGGAVCSERMEGAADARHQMRVIIRARIRELEEAVE